MAERGPGSAPVRVLRNDWSALTPPPLGAWEPRLAVSVVVPAHAAGATLPLTLAGLAAQTYPAHLLEVVVVDDGPGALDLPEVRPERTRVVRVADHGPGWGRARACRLGADTADGDVLHWLDADMLPEREEVEAQARWHHLLDHVVVLGGRTFVDPVPELGAPGDVRDAVAAGTLAARIPGELRHPHAWVEELYARTDDLRRAGWYAVRAHVGSTASVGRAVYDEAGGMDDDLRLGEDTELGVRLAAAGAVFVPDRAAHAWHLGPYEVGRRPDRVNTHNAPHLGARAPVLRARRVRGRGYRSPYLDVVLDGRGHEPGAVQDVVDAVLTSTLTDVAVTLLGDWAGLAPDDQRRAPLDDPVFDVRLLRDTYRDDPRVQLAAPAEAVSPRAPFTLRLPGVTWAPRPTAVEALVLHLEHTHDGLRLIDLGDGTAARLERTAAFARARRLLAATPADGPARPADEALDDVVAAVSGVGTVDRERAGFASSADVRPAPFPITGGPALDDAAAWARVERGMSGGMPGGMPGGMAGGPRRGTR